jgi:hypothetical protein
VADWNRGVAFTLHPNLVIGKPVRTRDVEDSVRFTFAERPCRPRAAWQRCFAREVFYILGMTLPLAAKGRWRPVTGSPIKWG